MCAVNWPIVFAGFKTVLDPLAQASWPIALGIIVFSFRNQIASLLNRIKQVTGFGGTAEFVPMPASADQTGEGPATEVATEANANVMPPADAVYEPMDAQFTDWLNERVPGNAELKLAWAIRSRSMSEAYRLHELNYRVIFGSQIQALKSLNALGRAPAVDFEAFFKAAAENPLWTLYYKDRTFEMWGNFLVNAGYVRFVPNTDPSEVEITPFGRQFLVWIVQSGLAENKPA